MSKNVLTPTFLETDNVDFASCGMFDETHNFLVYCISLFLNRARGWENDRILNETNSNNARWSGLLLNFAEEREPSYLEVRAFFVFGKLQWPGRLHMKNVNINEQDDFSFS